MRDEIERELAALVGLLLRYASHAVDMGTFGFGNLSDRVHRGKKMEIADYRLHIQDVWRIVRDGAIAVGFYDYYYPPRGSTISRDDFVARDAERSRRDDLTDDWLAHDGAAHVVIDVGGSKAGDLRVIFQDGCALESFASVATPDPDNGYDENWRLIPLGVTGDEPHFVVTAHGIER